MSACFSVTDRALEEEALRYESTFHSKGKRVLGISHLLSLYSDRAPKGESFDRSRGIKEESWGDKTTWLTVYEGPTENDNGCWELGEANRNRDIKSRVRRGILARLKTKLRERRKKKNGRKAVWQNSTNFWDFQRRGWKRKS